MDLDDLETLDPEDIDELLKELEDLSKPSPLDYVPHPKQKEFHEASEKIRFLCGGNRSGKTEAGALEAVYHSTGIYPDWYPKAQRWDEPTRGRIIVTDYAKGCGEVLQPKLETWLPKDKIIKIKKTLKGYWEKVYVKHSSGGISTIDIMTYEQDDKVFEGWAGHWAWFDEPPPRTKFIATLRGLIDYAGRAWLTLTPISEPWLYDDFIVNADEDIFYLHVGIRDNPHIAEKDIKSFEARLTEDEKEARMEGKFRHLVGRVYKEFDPKVHVVALKDTKIDSRWPTYFVMDPHDRRPHVAIWAKIDPFGTIHVFTELMFKGTIKETSKEILRRELALKIKPNDVIRILDPNKGRTPSNVTGLTLEAEFAKHAIYFTTDVNDSIQTGHLAVQERLMYNKEKPLSRVNCPKMYFVAEQTRNCVKQILTYVWDEYRAAERSAKEKPKDINKDFPDCIRYLVMSDPQFFTEGDNNQDPGPPERGNGTGYGY